MEAIDRLWAKVRKSDGCWEWTCGADIDGYGRFKDKGKTGVATRWIWQELNGPIPKGLMVLHHCDNPRCVRPDHLWLGDHIANMEDMRRKGRGLLGEKNHLTRLTKAQAQAILDAPGKQRDIAKQFGVCQGTVAHIKVARNWAHLQPDKTPPQRRLENAQRN